jgi:hypothetical protein
MDTMKSLAFIAVVLVFCGCVGGGGVPASNASFATLETTTSTSTLPADEVFYIVPTTTSTTFKVQTPGQITSTTVLSSAMAAYVDHRSPNCLEGGKPVVRMYGKMNCEHCNWSGPIFDETVMPYVEAGRIVARHWVFDREDDALTPAPEGGIPQTELDVFYSANQSTVPYFSFGCRFTRVGSVAYVQKDRKKEADTFRAAVEQILKEDN